MCYENVDFAISGHVHQSEYAKHGRIVVNPARNSATWRSFKEIVVDAHLKPGGYSIKKEYEIPPVPELQYIELNEYREGTHSRKRHKLLDYHSMQL